MLQKYLQLFIGLLIGVFLGFFIGKSFSTKQEPVFNTNISQASKTTSNSNNSPTKQVENTQKIPQKVYDVLNYVKKHHQPMDGYVGGREFKNREKLLPIYNESQIKIKYQEWDVNLKVEGRNRGRERLVTGDDERNWYTNNHYQSFIELKNY